MTSHHSTAGIYTKRDIHLHEDLYTEYGKPRWTYTLIFFAHLLSSRTIHEATARYIILPTDQLDPCLAIIHSINHSQPPPPPPTDTFPPLPSPACPKNSQDPNDHDTTPPTESPEALPHTRDPSISATTSPTTISTAPINNLAANPDTTD